MNAGLPAAGSAAVQRSFQCKGAMLVSVLTGPAPQQNCSWHSTGESLSGSTASTHLRRGLWRCFFHFICSRC